MMNTLNSANLDSHKGRPYTPQNKKLTLWQPSDNFLHCCIESRGCRFSIHRGSCVMCDYGIGKNLIASELEKALEDHLLPRLKNIKTVLFGSYGSVFDEYEISDECFDIILNFLSKHTIDNIIFETHYSTVNVQKLKRIKKSLSKSCEISIEMGYESCDEYILSNCLGKVMDLNKLRKTINEIHSQGMKATLNVFLGAPFISVQDQTLSSVRSIEWAFQNGADFTVIFPSNIKPFTLLHSLYLSGNYSEISHWQIIDVLNRIPVELLNKVSLSWYGDRENFYDNNEFPLIPPKACEKCHDPVFSFYRDFHSTKNSSERKNLLRDLLNSDLGCMCREDYSRDYNIDKERLSLKQIEEIVENEKNF